MSHQINIILVRQETARRPRTQRRGPHFVGKPARRESAWVGGAWREEQSRQEEKGQVWRASAGGGTPGLQARRKNEADLDIRKHGGAKAATSLYHSGPEHVFFIYFGWSLQTGALCCLSNIVDPRMYVFSFCFSYSFTKEGNLGRSLYDLTPDQPPKRPAMLLLSHPLCLQL